MNLNLNISHVPGSKAPELNGETKLKISEVIITEKGMASGLPLVDFMMEDENGNKFIASTSGRMINCLSAGIKGANIRNHGQEEP